MDCESCIHFVEHPFVRICDWDDYCDAHGNPLRRIDPTDFSVIFCPHFEE